jgi:hypothetical protein
VLVQYSIRPPMLALVSPGLYASTPPNRTRLSSYCWSTRKRMTIGTVIRTEIAPNIFRDAPVAIHWLLRQGLNGDKEGQGSSFLL